MKYFFLNGMIYFCNLGSSRLGIVHKAAGWHYSGPFCHWTNTHDCTPDSVQAQTLRISPLLVFLFKLLQIILTKTLLKFWTRKEH